MTRRVAMALIALAILPFGVVDGQERPAHAQSPASPNILIIVTDDQRGGLEVMPATGRYFKSEGVFYKNGYVTTPLCCPSRASIFTGRYAHNHGVKTNGEPSETRSEHLDHNSTVQRYLHDRGYTTAIFGKYLNFWPIANNPPYFDEWATGGLKYKNAEWNVNGDVQSIGTYNSVFIADKATEFIRRATDRPWLMYVTPHAPHGPFTAQAKYESAPVPSWDGNPAVFEKDESDKPGYVRRRDSTFRAGKRTRRAQLRTLMSVDDMVARIFDALNETGQIDNTLAFFISDNGYMWSEHGLRKKAAPYPQSVRVPFMVRWPGRVPAGMVDSRYAANIDIAPTIYSVTGVVPDLPTDGRNLFDTWTRRKRLTEYWCNVHICRRWAALQTPRYLYVEYFDKLDDGSYEVTFREYYEKSDRWQLTNLFKDGVRSNVPNRRELHDRLAALRQCVGRSGDYPCP